MKSAFAAITEAEGAVERVRALLDELAAAKALPADAVTDMQIALDEALANILTHGFADGTPHRIEVTLTVEPASIRAEIEDDCAAFDPLSVAPPELEASLQERRVGGLGLHFIRSLMTDVRYARVGARNRLVLARSLGAGADDPGRA